MGRFLSATGVGLHGADYKALICLGFLTTLQLWLLGGQGRRKVIKMSKDKTPITDKARYARLRREAIGQGLRRLYDGVVHEPVPDEFMDLLKKIDESTDPERSPS